MTHDSSAPQSESGKPTAPHSWGARAGHLTLLLAACRCAVPLGDVREVLTKLPATTPLPDSPSWLLGICSWRNELAALIDPLPILSANTEMRGGPWRRWGRPRIPDATLPPPVSTGFDGVAIVLGEHPPYIALAVDRLGPLLTGVASAAEPDVSAPSVLLPRYLARMIVAPDGAAYPVLRTRELLDDILAGVSEEEASDA